MRRILSQCQKELAQIFRDRLTLSLAFILPFMMLCIYGFSLRLEAKNIPLAVQDFDNSPLSHAYVERLYATNQFAPVPDQIAPGDRASAIDRGIAKAALIIPPEFSRRLKADQSVAVQVLVDGTEVNNALVIQNTMQAATTFFLRQEGMLPGQRLVSPQFRLWFNPGRKEALFILPGVFALILWIFPSLLSAIAMVREKETGTILQLYTSSMSAIELILGKALAFLLLGIGQAVLVMSIGAAFFRMSFAGDPLPLIVGTLLFISTAVLFGLLVGSRNNNVNSTLQLIAFTGIPPTLALSGFIYPLNNTPFPLSLLTYLVPARYYIEITRDAYVRGTGWSGVWWAELVLLLMALWAFNGAYKQLNRMQLPS